MWKKVTNQDQQIKRFSKTNDGRIELSGLGHGSDWWNKLEPMVIAFRKGAARDRPPLLGRLSVQAGRILNLMGNIIHIIDKLSKIKTLMLFRLISQK